MSKTYILDIKGICIEEDEFENTTIHICRNGEWCEIPFDKDDIVEIEENEDDNANYDSYWVSFAIAPLFCENQSR